MELNNYPGFRGNVTESYLSTKELIRLFTRTSASPLTRPRKISGHLEFFTSFEQNKSRRLISSNAVAVSLMGLSESEHHRSANQYRLILSISHCGPFELERRSCEYDVRWTGLTSK